MLLDVRTYTCRPGRLKPQLDLYEKMGLAAQKRHLGEPLAFLVTETGPINTYMHIWVYEDAADRSKKRAAMLADPEWQAFIAASAAEGNLVAQENKLMTPAPFAPVKRS
ncbi:NIPSNAP family protein [Ferrovibrio sp.]|uniref:NIPSNAP family protein n=1 Tax=Ferrovibrio sp. TaxID=1917215 RepID=UPI003D0EBC69